MKAILEVSKKHFLDYKKNYLIYFTISLLMLGIFYLGLQKNYSDLIYTALYAVISIPIFGMIIIKKSTFIYKATDIIFKKLRMIVMMVYPPIPVLILTLIYYQIRMYGWNVGEHEALYFALVSSFFGFIALLILMFAYLELNRWRPNWPVFFGKLSILALYVLVITVYPSFFHDPYTPTSFTPAPYYTEIVIAMIVLFVAHITTYILWAYTRVEY